MDKSWDSLYDEKVTNSCKVIPSFFKGSWKRHEGFIPVRKMLSRLSCHGFRWNKFNNQYELWQDMHMQNRTRTVGNISFFFVMQ